MDIVERAESALRYFTTKTRDGKTIWVKTDDAPDWVDELVFVVHDEGDILPDDYRYEYLVDSLNAIIDSGGDFDRALEYMEEGVDVYNSALLDWLDSHSMRVGYVDEAREEFGPGETVMNDIMAGQALERGEVFRKVWDFLEEQWPVIEEEEEEEEEEE